MVPKVRKQVVVDPVLHKTQWRAAGKALQEPIVQFLLEAAPLRKTEPDDTRGLSEFQNEVVQLAAVFNGDHFLSSFSDEIWKKMSEKEAHMYIKGAISWFVTASREAINLGAAESAIVDMRSFLTTRSVVHN